MLPNDGLQVLLTCAAALTIALHLLTYSSFVDVKPRDHIPMLSAGLGFIEKSITDHSIQ